MANRKLMYLAGFMIFILLFSSCYSSRKGRSGNKRYNRERCDCSRFSNMVHHENTCTVDWMAHHGRESDTR